MRTLVTGGAGFIGSHLCHALIERGEHVICLDNLFTGSRRNVAHLIGHSRFEVMRHDVIEPYRIEVDRIFNLACPASPVHYRRDPIRTVRTNVQGMIHALECAASLTPRSRRVRVVQASTSEVYGDPEQHPQPETYVGHVDCLGPRACYDEGKRAAETLCVDYANERGVDVRVARIFNTYGPHMAVDDGRVVSNLVMQALRREPLTVYGDGEQTRSFCYVSDLVRGLLALMDGDELGVERVGPFNLGNPEEITIKDLAVAVRDAVVGCTSAVLHRGSLKGDPRRRKPDDLDHRD